MQPNSENKVEDLKKEFTFYESLTIKDDDLLGFWKQSKLSLPLLAEFSQRYLCVPATSVLCERLFSKAGIVITPDRWKLKTELANMLLFLEVNL